MTKRPKGAAVKGTGNPARETRCMSSRTSTVRVGNGACGNAGTAATPVLSPFRMSHCPRKGSHRDRSTRPAQWAIRHRTADHTRDLAAELATVHSLARTFADAGGCEVDVLRRTGSACRAVATYTSTGGTQ